jgi:hypothetical protein
VIKEEKKKYQEDCKVRTHLLKLLTDLIHYFHTFVFNPLTINPHDFKTKHYWTQGAQEAVAPAVRQVRRAAEREERPVWGGAVARYSNIFIHTSVCWTHSSLVSLFNPLTFNPHYI